MKVVSENGILDEEKVTLICRQVFPNRLSPQMFAIPMIIK